MSIRKCKGGKRRIYQFVIDDDWIEPNYLEESIKYFDDPNVGFIFSQANVYNEKTQKIEKNIL